MSSFSVGQCFVNSFFFYRLVARFLTSVRECIDQGLKHLGPTIQDRLENDEKYGMEWAGRPVGTKICQFKSTC